MKNLHTFETFEHDIVEQLVDTVVDNLQSLTDFGYALQQDTLIEKINDVLNQLWKDAETATRNVLETRRATIIRKSVDKFAAASRTFEP